MTTAHPPLLHAAPFHTTRWTCVGLAKADSDDGRKALAELCGAYYAPGGVDTEHLVSTLGFTPTLLDATGVKMIPDIDGRTFLPALKGTWMAKWDRVFTFYNQGGLFSEKGPIAKGTGLAWPAIVKAAQTNPAIKERVELLVHRVPEEFFDLSSDRFERHNLIADASRQQEIESMRADLLAPMQCTGDPFAEAFAKRQDRAVYLSARDKVNAQFHKPAPKKKPPTPK